MSQILKKSDLRKPQFCLIRGQNVGLNWTSLTDFTLKRMITDKSEKIPHGSICIGNIRFLYAEVQLCIDTDVFLYPLDSYIYGTFENSTR